MTKYRWSTPYAWLEEKAKGWTRGELEVALVLLAAGVESDAIQDQFEMEMVEDGYFDEVGEDDMSITSSNDWTSKGF